MRCLVTLLLIFVIIACLSVSGCSDGRRDNFGLPSDKYLGIQAGVDESFSVIEGKSGMFVPEAPLPHMLGSDVTVNDSLEIVWDETDFTYNVLSYVGNVREKGIYGLPHSIRPAIAAAADLVVLDVDGNGTAYMSYGNESFFLKPGDNWQSPVLATRTSAYNFSTNSTAHAENGSVYTVPVTANFTVKYDTTIVVYNKGIFNKSDFIRMV